MLVNTVNNSFSQYLFTLLPLYHWPRRGRYYWWETNSVCWQLGASGSCD